MGSVMLPVVNTTAKAIAAPAHNPKKVKCMELLSPATVSNSVPAIQCILMLLCGYSPERETGMFDTICPPVSSDKGGFDILFSPCLRLGCFWDNSERGSEAELKYV